MREAAKMPVGEILMDLRQARKGLRQAKGELQRVRDDEAAKMRENGGDADGNDAGAAAAEAGVAVGRKKKEAQTNLAGASRAASATAAAAPTRLSVVSEGSERSTSTTASSSSSSSSLSPAAAAADPFRSAEGEEAVAAAPPGVRKLSAFVEKAEVRLSSIERSANKCVGLCKDLGEYFGEGADEAQSHHIFRTLVQFLDLLQEAKKVEGLC